MIVCVQHSPDLHGIVAAVDRLDRLVGDRHIHATVFDIRNLAARHVDRAKIRTLATGRILTLEGLELAVVPLNLIVVSGILTKGDGGIQRGRPCLRECRDLRDRVARHCRGNSE